MLSRENGKYDGGGIPLTFTIKCPKCGTEINDRTDYTSSISELLKQRNGNTKENIRKIIIEMSKYHIISKKDVYTFLSRIVLVEDNMINRLINRFYSKKEYITKGILYLAAIIKNYHNGLEKASIIERKMYGSKPPVLNEQLITLYEGKERED